MSWGLSGEAAQWGGASSTSSPDSGAFSLSHLGKTFFS